MAEMFRVWLVEPAALEAVIVTGYKPVCEAVPEITPEVRLKLSPVGKVPDRDRAGVGKPVVVTVKELLTPDVKAADDAEVIVGDAFTLKVKLWLTVATALLALKVTTN